MYDKLFLGVILLAIAFEVAADILFKKWSLDGRNTLLLIGIGLYTIGTIGWAFSLKFESLSKAVSVFMVLNLIAVILAGYFIFKEEVSLVNGAGIILGVVSVVLMGL